MNDNATQRYEITVSGTGFYRTTVTASSPEEALDLATNLTALPVADWELDLSSMVAGDDYEVVVL